MKLLTVLTVFAGIICAGLLGEYLAERRDRRYSAPGKIIDVGHGKMHLSFIGERQNGSPLVILESGMGSWFFYWRFVQPEMARWSRVCAYDRHGLGWSAPRDKQRIALRIASELHEALWLAGEPGPYLVVGHSLGGLFVRQFARLYPDEVAGMVLIDSAHEDQIARMPGARKEISYIRNFFTLLDILYRLGILRMLGQSPLARFTSVRDTEEKWLFLATLLASRYFETSRDEPYPYLHPSNQKNV